MTDLPISDDQISTWTAAQLEIASKVCYEDDNDWFQFLTITGFEPERDIFVAGADISFSTTDADFSVGTLTIVKLARDGKSELVLSRSQRVDMPHPYVPSFLGFRESPVVSQMLANLPSRVREKIDCLLLDGNGILHPRRAGLACHVGVAEGIPTIGVSKALLCVDGLDEKEVRRKVVAESSKSIDVVGRSNFAWAKAILSGNAQTKPIYVSVGHRVSLETATRVVRLLCEYRIPAPVRYADMHSRAFLRGDKIDIYRAEAFLELNY